MNKIAITCPTYKEAFNLRKVLIELNIKWAEGQNLDGYYWKEKWEMHKHNTVYYINNNCVQYGYLPNLVLYQEYIRYSTDEFIKKHLL